MQTLCRQFNGELYSFIIYIPYIAPLKYSLREAMNQSLLGTHRRDDKGMGLKTENQDLGGTSSRALRYVRACS
jgi:hypothetical protein